jgi:hypothetical protein
MNTSQAHEAVDRLSQIILSMKDQYGITGTIIVQVMLE